MSGLVPEFFPRVSCSFADSMIAPSGIEAVSKERIDTYCWSPLWSPTRMAFESLPVVLILPPTLAFSSFSRIQPSSVACETNVTSTGWIVTVVTVMVSVAWAVLFPPATSRVQVLVPVSAGT